MPQLFQATTFGATEFVIEIKDAVVLVSGEPPGAGLLFEAHAARAGKAASCNPIGQWV